MYAEVIPESKSYKATSFTYKIPENLQANIDVGSIVTVPFGKKKIRGVVAEINKAGNIKNNPFEIKAIDFLDSTFHIPPSYIPITSWISQNYFCTVGEALGMFLPPLMKRPPKDNGKTDQQEEAEAINLKKLSDSQASIYSKINSIGIGKPHLIYGVTGSGKTEIYIHLAADMIASGKSVIVLVPEIILTPQTVERFQEVFGNNIALIHSNLSQGEKYQSYRDFFLGRKKILIGPRSALLVPNRDIGLIIIDEEHEEAYKQDNSPRYHATDLAEQIARALGAKLVLGSATPRIESYYKAKNEKYILHQIKNRYNKLLLPPSEVIDLRNELRSGNSSIISEKLFKALQQITARKKQAILFLNRRGSSTFVSCRECSFVIKCPNCDIPLVHHSTMTSDHLYCHHCDHKADLPSVCPDCHGVKIKYFGAGVEKVESEVNAMLPSARVRRIDATTIKNKCDYENFYRDFKNHRFDIAIGTQMITKGLDLPHVDLVGIISADTGLHMPYFRASEKIFRLVTQVSGRSGRAAHPGQTIIQTYWPESAAIGYAAKHDFEGFYEWEIKQRQSHNYPPFCDLIRIVSEHEKPKKAKSELLDLCLELDKLKAKYSGTFDYIGPGLCFFQRIRNKWRYHILIKLLYQESEELKNNLVGLWKENLNLIWDMDPNDLL